MCGLGNLVRANTCGHPYDHEALGGVISLDLCDERTETAEERSGTKHEGYSEGKVSCLYLPLPEITDELQCEIVVNDIYTMAARIAIIIPHFGGDG